ncbi:MAG: hypothetical protein JW953_06720 [Anaerolineae bacterium]|nr:hypothetical protein [Anaerolineae bacterium]
MPKILTQTDKQNLFNMAYQYWLARNWDEAMAAEAAAEEVLEGNSDGYAAWRDLIDYLEVFYRENGRGMTQEEGESWWAGQGPAGSGVAGLGVE